MGVDHRKHVGRQLFRAETYGNWQSFEPACSASVRSPAPGWALRGSPHRSAPAV